MSRSLWKGYFISNNIVKKSFTNKFQKKIWSRNSTIPLSLVDKRVLVHNGKTFKKIYITRDKVGFKFGEFSFTRQFTKKFKLKIKKTKNK